MNTAAIGTAGATCGGVAGSRAATSAASVTSGGTKIARIASQARSERASDRASPVVLGGRGGDHVDRVGERRARRQERGQLGARSCAGSSGTSRPPAWQASAQRIPGPPALVTIATRSPRGHGLRRRAARRRRTARPACRCGSRRPGRNSASTVTSEAASSAPVCEAVARAPAAERPLLTATIGLLRAEARARSARTCAGCRTTPGTAAPRRCAGPAPSTASKSLPERSALLPTETNEDRPSPSRSAASMIAMPSPPLCERKPTRPAAAWCGANVALSRTSGGGVEHAQAVGADEPHARHRGRPRAAPRWRRAPSRADLGEAGRDHDQRAHARRPRTARAASSTCAAGTTITARSTALGELADRAVGAAAPARRRPCSLTAYTAPLKPAASRLCRISPPDRSPPARGADHRHRARGSGTLRDRRDRGDLVALLEARRRASADSEVGSSISIASGVERSSTGKPLSRNTSIMRWLSGSTSAMNVAMPCSSRRRRRGGRA